MSKTEKNNRIFTQVLSHRAAKIFFPSLFGILCFYYIVVSFEWRAIFEQLRAVNVLIFFTASVAATLAFWFLRAVRWAYLLRGESFSVPFYKIYLITAVALGFANFTPFQTGEALKVEMLRKYGARRAHGYTRFLFEKLLDLAIIAFSAVIGAAVLLKNKLPSNLIFIIAGASIALLIVSAIFFFWFGRKRAKSAAAAYRIFPDINSFIFTIFISLLSWAAIAAGWKYIFASGGVELSFLQTVSVISLTTVVAIVSFVPGAFGVSEISIAALLSEFGYTDALAQTGAILIGIYSLVILLLTTLHLAVLKTLNYTKAKDESGESERVAAASIEKS